MAQVRHFGHFPKRFVTNCGVSDSYLGAAIPRQFPDVWMPLEYAMAIYWIVKKWRLSYTKSWSEINNAFVWDYSPSFDCSVGQVLQQETDNGTLVQDYLFGTPPSSEKKLVCGVDQVFGDVIYYPDYGDPYFVTTDFGRPHFDFNVIAGRIPSTTPPGGAGTFSSARIYFNDPNYAAFYRQGTAGREYRPAIYFQSQTFRWGEIYAANWSGSLGAYGTFSYKLLGQTFSCPIYAYNSRNTDADFSNNLSLNVTLEAVEYWPYAD